jgi:hypothetical protein
MISLKSFAIFATLFMTAIDFEAGAVEGGQCLLALGSVWCSVLLGNSCS